MGNKLLVVTALEETWGNVNEELFFSGEWCKKYERQQILESRIHETNAFHWDDRDKLNTDYDYLKSLHHRLLKSLSGFLNNLHGVNYPVRYWQIILDPWLLSYVGVIFDKWETIRKVFDSHNEFDVIFLPDKDLVRTYLCWSEYMKEVVDDRWNQGIYQRILISEYSDKVHISYSELLGDAEIEVSTSRNNKPVKAIAKHLFSSLLSGFDILLGKFFRNNKIAFVGSFFNFYALIRMNIAIGQVPRFYLNDFPAFKKKQIEKIVPLAEKRVHEQLDFNHSGRFEHFVKKWIIRDLPSSVIEYYSELYSKASRLNINPKIIVTANPHWGNLAAKFWFAVQVNRGVKLVILEHGGSLPAHKELFDFEEDIADSRGTWFLPYHSKHVQVPPSKLVGFRTSQSNRRKKYDGGYLCLVSSEQARYVYRVHFYPMAQQCLATFDLLTGLYHKLNKNIQEESRLKAYYNQGWNTRARYSEVMGPEKIISDLNLKQAMLESRIIVCSYPETTFSEAMATGVPTILLYPDYLYERNPIAYPLIEILRSVKIIFTDSEVAANHINQIWSDPGKWWNSSETLHARDEFRRQALNIDFNWVKDWKDYLKKVEKLSST